MNVGNRIRAVILVAVMLVAAGALVSPGVSAGESAESIIAHKKTVEASGDIFKMDLSGIGVVVKSAGVWYAWAHGQEVEKAAAIVAAAERAKKAKVVAPVQHANVQRSGGVNWDGIGICETGHDPNNPNQGQPFWALKGRTFSGGLGIYNGAWDDFGGREFGPTAGYASREQQIIVAERIYARFGLSGWGCKAYG